MIIRNYLLAIVFLMIVYPNAYAMRCGDKLVYEGDSKYTVLSKCGEPLDKLVYEENVPLYNAAGYQIGYGTNTVETWIYQKSPVDFQYELIFDYGKLKQINVNRNP
ncbi:TPA: DUF2845 domain-containing protein [Legionella pneumophila]|uniref:DUF2845 domain-containing protein n=3 Tax=Legionella pneumophila TaxID=446 RepID=Q5ZW10_LEGPH|nr:DUF2845 domain-containing protein [Legionella pneumophila]ERH42271.1 hypothetical protein N751_03330 [Legionella pneumophila str. Leg01/11]ERH46863.1 hypothetical protein N750_00955 [Legionella pneumophila str. Leg01/53]ERI48329.1 hypothetical protein N749_10455 [Legionella pneumophila str. Leg01/20]WBV62102.1 DUF2845 domain-containing protein [Legionella pneumophila 130b]AAU27361.1 hypothetical protein lpg1278 [Legionella pneumophila subsp. pneumophila str. Philadelphia 1]